MVHYEDIVDSYTTIQSLVLSFWIIAMLLFQLLIFGPIISYQERRKRLTRSMLLILPKIIIMKSDLLQEAIIKLDYN
jgi:hypothetical protein